MIGFCMWITNPRNELRQKFYVIPKKSVNGYIGFELNMHGISLRGNFALPSEMGGMIPCNPELDPGQEKHMIRHIFEV
jgi:hypothetical protein